MALDKQKEGSELSGFNINKLSTDIGLVEFAKIAKNASLRDMKKWGDTGLKTKLVGATDGDVLYKDYLHRRLGMGNKNEIDSTTMVALKKIAESGKVTKIPYTTQTKGKEVVQTSTVKKAREATAGTQSIESIVSIKNEGVTQDNAKKILELLPTSNGLPTKKAVEMWDRILLSEKKAIQRNIGTKDDGILGRKTLLALQKRANNEVYAGDNFEFPKNPVVDKKLAALATTVDAVAVDAKTPAVAVDAKTPAVAVDAKTPAVAVDAKTPAVAVDAKTPAVAVDAKTPAVGLETKYQNEMSTLKTEFDPSKYTYVSFTMDTKESGKITKVYQIDTQALKAEGITDVTTQNSFLLMHMVSRGAAVMPKYFRDIDTISTNAIPGNLRGLDRVDYANALLKSQNIEIKPNILSDVNGLGVGLKKTLLPFGLDKLVGLGKTGNASVDTDERKSEMQKIEKKLQEQSNKIYDTNNRENLGEHYVDLFLKAKSFAELQAQAKNDPILQEILSTFSTPTNSQGDELGLAQEDILERIRANINKQGRDVFKKKFGEFINKRSTDGFIVRNTNFLFDDVALQSITSKDGSGILKGNIDGGREIYLSAQRLDLNAAKLSYTKDGKSMELSNETAQSFKGQTIDLGMQQSNASAEVQAMMKETKIRIDNNGIAYLITSPKYIGTLSQIMSRTGDALTSKTAIEVYKIVGTVLLTLKLAGNHIGTPNIGTPNFPSIDVNLPGLHTPDVSSLNTALGGYVLTGALLNRKIAFLERDLEKNHMETPSNTILTSMAAKYGEDAITKLDKEILDAHRTGA